MSETDHAIDRTLRAMTAVDEAAAERSQARVLAAIREGTRAGAPSAAQPGAQSGAQSGRPEDVRERSPRRSARPGWLSRQPWPLPVAAAAAAAAVLVAAALVIGGVTGGGAGGGFWGRSRPDVSPAPTQVASAPTPAPDAASATSPLPGSAQPAAVTATASLPSVASRPPLDVMRGARGAREGRDRMAARDDAREDQPLAAREKDPPIGDPILALHVESITPALLAGPKPITTARVEADAIVIEPIRISAFDAPPTPRSH